MPMRRSFRSVLSLFLAASVWGGCAASGPQGAGTSPDRRAEAPPESAPDSSQFRRSSPERRAASSVSALRAAYVDGAYDRVVRQARERLQDSRSATDSVQVKVLLGRAEQARGNHERAIEVLREARAAAYETDRSLTYIDRALGESYGALYRWSSAASAYRRVLEARPTDRAARQALAEAYRHARQWADAREQYVHLVRRDSSNGAWWARLANCEVELGEIGTAISHFARAHELLPQSADVALILSRFYRSTMRPDAARAVVDTTLTYRPGDSRLWRRRADLAFERDRFDRARRAYERTIATGDSSATPYRRIGMIDVKRRDYDQALTSLRRSYRKDTTNTRTTLYLGISYLHLDSLQRASTHLRRTIDREARGPITEAFIQTGNVNDRRGDVSAAVRAYRTALRLRSERTDVYFHLANLYDEHYREKETAARHYRRFLRASDSTQESLRTYARDRLETLRSTLHMQEAAVSSDSSSRP